LQLLNVQVPFYFKDIIDRLADTANTPMDISDPNLVWKVAGAGILGCEYPPAFFL
jgi:hypothetical protein